MKRYYVLFLLVAIGFSFYYCSKRTDSSADNLFLSDSTALPAEKVKRVASNVEGITCNCTPTQAFCKAECIFSECCLCWNPSTETGSCGCYFGVAKCRTSLIGKDAPATTGHRVRFYPKRFDRFLTFLNRSAIPADSLQHAYEQLMKTPADTLSAPGSQEIKLAMDGVAYAAFYATYYRCVASYPGEVRDQITVYLNNVTPKQK